MMPLAKSLAERMGQGFALPFLVLTLALIVGPTIAAKLRLPATVGLVLSGMVLGPHCTGLLKGNEIALQAWGTFGLLYLMFSAALELDLALLAQMKKVAFTFAILSFAIPCVLGLVSARLLNYRWAPALLMGSNWASHTLITYPMLRATGLGRNRAVTTVVGATAVTDTSALLVLTGVSASVRKAGRLGAEGAEIAIGLALLAIWTLVALPQIARWFFAQVGSERSYRVVFGMAAFLSGAVLAEATSIDAIIGAFFAGLGLTRVIPERSPLMDRVQFFGSALFIPTFLVSVGVLLEPRVLVVPRTLFVAGVFTLAVLGGKALAAAIAGRLFHFTWPEVGVMSGLSGSQAAATLATTLIGVHLGILDSQTLNAVLLVVLVSLIVTPLVVAHFAKSVARGEAASGALGSSVLVAVRDQETRPLLSVAAHIAAADGGLVLPLSIAPEESAASEVAERRHLAEAAEEWLAREGFESRCIFRIATSVEAGLRETVLGDQPTLLLVEWRFRQPGEPARNALRIARDLPVPVLLVHGPVEPFDRLLVVVRRADLVRSASANLAFASLIAHRLVGKRRLAYLGAPAAPLATLFGSSRRFDRIESADPIAWLLENASHADVVVLPGLDAAREALERIPRIAERRVLVAIAACGGSADRQAHSEGEPNYRGDPSRS